MNTSLTTRVWSGAELAARDSEQANRVGARIDARHSLGTLAHAVHWWAGVSRHGLTAPAQVHAVIVAGDHPDVTAAQATAQTPDETLAQVRALHNGTAASCRLAEPLDAHLHVADISMSVAADEVPPQVGSSRINRGSSRVDDPHAAEEDDIVAAFTWGRERVDGLADRGADLLLLGNLGAGASVPATALITLLTSTDLVDNVGRSDVADDVMWMRKTAMIRDATLRTRPHTHDPLGMLAVCGGADMAAITGILLQGAVRGLPILIDGVTTAAAALIAERMLPGAHVWWAVADSGAEPAALRAYERTHLSPWLRLGIGNGDTTGALIAVSLLNSALVIMNAST